MYRIDWTDAFSVCEPFLQNKAGRVCIRGGEFSAINEFLNYIKYTSKKRKITVINFDSQSERCRTIAGIMYLLAAKLGVTHNGGSVNVGSDIKAFKVDIQNVTILQGLLSESAVVESLLKSTSEHLRKYSNKTVLIFRNLARYPPSTQDWIWHELWPDCLNKADPDAQLAVFVGSEPSKNVDFDGERPVFVDLCDLYNGDNFQRAISDVARILVDKGMFSNCEDALPAADALVRSAEGRPSLLFSRVSAYLTFSL